MEQHSLYELNQYIRRVLALNLSEALWVSAELFQLGRSKGHCFLSLVQKGEGEEGEIVAQAEAVIWRKQFLRLQRKLGQELTQLLQPGTALLLQVKVDFHERYGYKLLVQDIDLSYTLGKLEMRRREVRERLQREGLLALNRERPLPLVPQRLAVISSETAAGLQDFQRQLADNEYGYQYRLRLFPAAMQGNNTVREVSIQLERIQQFARPFDAVVIIRGGGARLDLAVFDEYKLCQAVAQYSLPVLVGIGHEVDDVLLDSVAHTALKTPTAVAEFLLSRSMQFEARLLQMGQQAGRLAQEKLRREQLQLERQQQQLEWLPKRRLQAEQQQLQALQQQLAPAAKARLKLERQQLEHYDYLLSLLRPEATLRRGYSITLRGGRIISSVQSLNQGDRITIRMADGDLESEIQ